MFGNHDFVISFVEISGMVLEIGNLNRDLDIIFMIQLFVLLFR